MAATSAPPPHNELHHSQPHTLKLLSINIRGLNTPEKRSHLLHSLKQAKIHIALIQETHFRTDSTPKLHNSHFPMTFHATNSEAKSKGVSILFAKHCPFQVTDVQRDPLGRFLFIKGNIHQKTFTIANIYAPNSGQVTFFHSTLQLLSSFYSGTLIVGGDLNVPLTPSVDTSNGTSSLTYRALRSIKQQLSNLLLHDTWRTLHPKEKDFTFFSPPHNKYSRIDHFFLSQKDLTFLTKATIEPSLLSDHSPITMTLQFSTLRPRTRIWRLDSSLLTDEADVRRLSTYLSDFFSTNTSTDVTPAITWAAHKCVIRGELMSIAAQRNKLRFTRINDLTTRIRRLEQTHKASLAAATLTELIQAREELLETLNVTLKRKFALTQKLYYEFGNKAGKFLARALQTRKASNTIHKIISPAGEALVTNEDIAEQFTQYFSKLYNLPPSTSTTDAPMDRPSAIKEFLAQYGPTPLSPEDAQSLDLPLSVTELQAALKQMKKGKSPGPDGLSACYYTSFGNILLPHLTKALNNLTPDSIANKDLLEAHITLLPKPGKDPTLVTNYRPISLLNVDLKLYAKALANRILPFIPNLISLDQVGFVPGREARDNTTKALNIHHWLRRTSTPGFFLSLDAEKAFDRVAWDYMEASLRRIGLPPLMLQMVLALYSFPKARIRVNGELSGAFSVSNGTRQGCPLSPLIFILTMEPMLRRLKDNPAIKGVGVLHNQYKLAAYADDILLFLTDPITTIPNLLADFTLFKNLSNLQINFEKSKALNITLPITTVALCKHNFPFSWENSDISYLGIKLTTNLSDLYAKNFLPLILSIQSDLRKWHLGSFSWLGRIAILKMNILPRILYLLQAIPINLPTSFFLSYKRICRNFIWATKAPRLSWVRLTLPKQLGGLGLPDIQKYHWACHLTRVVDWHIHRPSKDWITLEDSLTSIPIANSPWITPRLIPRDFSSHPLIGATLSIFKLACKLLKTSPSPGPMTPLDNNPGFPPGLTLKDKTLTTHTTQARANQFFRNGSLLSQPLLAANLPNHEIPFFKYLQLRHFLQTTPHMSHWHRDHTPFELLCLSTEPQNHLISTLYALLFSGHQIKQDKLVLQWENDLSINLSPNEWGQIFTLMHKGSINVSTQENRYKLFSKWYRTPEKIHHFHPTIPPTCWRCGADRGTLLHIWWDCNLIRPFWQEINQLITQITTFQMAPSPALYLLHHTHASLRSYKKSLTLHLINAANLCIPALWRNTTPPTVQDWIRRVDRIADMENLISQSTDHPTKFYVTWASWLHYKQTQSRTSTSQILPGSL